MIRATPDFPARSAAQRETFSRRLRATGVVCACFTSALVLAQDPKPAPPPAKTAVKKPLDANAVKQREAVAKAQAARLQAVAKAKLANRDRLIQRYTQQGRQIVRGELLLVRTVCQLKNEQLRPIGREIEQTLGDFIVDILDNRNTRLRVPGQPSNSDATKRLQEHLAAVINKHLTHEQSALYKSEVNKRDANRKQAALNFLLDALDRDLVLSTKQRETLRESLSAHWDDGWYLFLEYALFGNEFYDMALEQYIVPVLTENQKRIWQGLQKVQGLWGFGNNTVGVNGENDDFFVEIGLAEKSRPKPAAPVMKGN